MSAVNLSRRGFLGGLLAAAAGAAVVTPTLPKLVSVAYDPVLDTPSPFTDVTQTMVEDAIAEAREFNLRELMWTARLFQHGFVTIGRTREQALMEALRNLLDTSTTYRVLPDRVCEHLSQAYGRMWDDSQYDIDHIELMLTPEQMGMPELRGSLVPSHKRWTGRGQQLLNVPDVEAGRRLQEQIGGASAPAMAHGTNVVSGRGATFIKSIAGQPTRSWSQGET